MSRSYISPIGICRPNKSGKCLVQKEFIDQLRDCNTYKMHIYQEAIIAHKKNIKGNIKGKR
jgi:hypothetical protein